MSSSLRVSSIKSFQDDVRRKYVEFLVFIQYLSPVIWRFLLCLIISNNEERDSSVTLGCFGGGKQGFTWLYCLLLETSKFSSKLINILLLFIICFWQVRATKPQLLKLVTKCLIYLKKHLQTMFPRIWSLWYSVLLRHTSSLHQALQRAFWRCVELKRVCW